MKTDALINLLATGAGPAPRAVAARRLWPAAALGLVCSALLARWALGWVPHSLLLQPTMWLKLAYAAALALAAGWLAARLARPVPRVFAPRGLWLAVVLAMLAWAWYGLPNGAVAGAAADSAAAGWSQAWLGHSWTSCSRNVLLLSVPALAACLWALRGLAPTRLRAAGAAAGLLAGGVGALGYALACTELSPAFVVLWYTLGIALTAALGAVLGPRVLRW